MDKVYYLDLQTLLDYLQGQSAILSTSVNVPALREPCRGVIFLKEGTVLECLIQTPSGMILASGADAYATLRARDQWQVRIQPDVEHVLHSLIQPSLPEASSPAPPAFSQAPRQLRPLDAHLLNSFTMKQRLVLRLVFTMVNGERTVEQIKAQLNLSPAVVEEALTTLRTLGVIS
jgi:hypothetical protein